MVTIVATTLELALIIEPGSLTAIETICWLSLQRQHELLLAAAYNTRCLSLTPLATPTFIRFVIYNLTRIYHRSF